MLNLPIIINGEATKIDITYRPKSDEEDIKNAMRIVETIKKYPKLHCTFGKDDAGVSYFHIVGSNSKDIKEVYTKIAKLTE